MNKHNSKGTKGTQGRSTITKTAIVGLKQRDGKVRAKSFDRVTSRNILEYINNNVKKGSVLSTDEARFYLPINQYEKVKVNHLVREFVNGMASTNAIESVWSVLKRGYHGTFHHFSRKHMDKYINEFTFRLNEGNCQIDTKDRMKSLFNNMAGKNVTYRELISSQ